LPRRQATRIAIWVIGVAAVLIGLSLPFSYWRYRFTTSMTNDAFVESRIVNLSPQTSGFLKSVLVEEHTQVEKGQLIAEIDPLPKQRDLNLARAKTKAASVQLEYEKVTLDRLKKEYPLKVAAAKKDVEVAKAVLLEAQTRLEVTRTRTEKGVKEAQANVDAAKATLDKAKLDYDRYRDLAEKKSVPEIRAEEANRTYGVAKADHTASLAKLDTSRAELGQIRIAEREVDASRQSVEKAEANERLAELINLQIEEQEVKVRIQTAEVETARRNEATALTQLQNCRLIAPFDAIIVKRYRTPGDNVPMGSPVVSLYNPKLRYVTANMEEDRLEGVGPGNSVIIWIDRFDRRFMGKVVWIDQATGANFALVPRDVSTGEFTKVPQRVAIRIALDPDDRLPRVVPGLSATVAISHEPGDAESAAREEKEMKKLAGEGMSPVVPSAELSETAEPKKERAE
jgi:membrane fusion protein (multidrug efflux system)